MKTTYTAIDGKTFETEDDCVRHEEFLSKRPGLIKDMILVALQTGWHKDEALSEVIQLFDEKIGFRSVEGLCYELAAIFVAYHSCLYILETGAPEELERAQDRLRRRCADLPETLF
ncbi:MAG: hypothetical protein VKI83_01515 [Synechococcaceae cyanobacterium]|nr:hypothetical protein [Synechococcaceae cyanobacterium]